MGWMDCSELVAPGVGSIYGDFGFPGRIVEEQGRAHVLFVFFFFLFVCSAFFPIKAFMGETNVTKHHSNSPLVKRRLQQNGSGEVSPVYSPNLSKNDAVGVDAKKTE